MRGNSESAILICGWILACAGSGVKKVTDECVAAINSEFAHLRQIGIDGVP